MIQLTPLAKIVSLSYIGLPISLFSIYLLDVIATKIIKKELKSNFDKKCFKLCHSLYSVYVILTIIQSVTISSSVLYSIFKLIF